MAAGYTINSGVCAMSAATAKTCANIIAAANAIVNLCELIISADGATSSAVPILVELAECDQGTTGTAGSSPTPQQIRGRVRTVQSSAGVAYSAEPATLTVYKAWYQPAFNGLVIKQSPLGREEQNFVAASTEGLCVRITAPATVNTRTMMEFEEGG